MPKHRPKPKLPTVPRRRVARQILAIASAPAPLPSISRERLKGGEINWKVLTSASTLERAREVSNLETRKLIIESLELEALERDLRAKAKAEAPVAGLEAPSA